MLSLVAESFIGADGKKKKRTKKGGEEIIESDFEYEIVSDSYTNTDLPNRSNSKQLDGRFTRCFAGISVANPRGSDRYGG